MPDYDLNGLGPRAFEHMVQALVLRIYGLDAVVFGDGPDGGREATFTARPSGESTWNGYCVVQAKFRQRPEDARSNGRWLTTQLDDEFAAFERGRRRRPQYYVVATNVILSANEDRGAKDQVLAHLAARGAKIGLQGHALWDFDHLCRLLDGHADIRQAYAAMITPGDVLAATMRRLAPHVADFDEVLSSYLQRELVADRFARLEEAGHATEDRIPIAKVFVDLPAFDRREGDPSAQTSRRPPAERFVAAVLQQCGAIYRPSGIAANSSPSPRPPEALGRTVLLGGPGQGKSTLGQFICQILRAALLKDRPNSSLTPEAREAIGIIRQQCESEQIGHPTGRRFPIRIALSEFGRALSQESHSPVRSVLSYIAARIEKRVDRVVQPADMRAWLRTYPWLLVLDGLDEVPPSSNRDSVLSAVHDFLVEASEVDADLMVIATTRPQGYNRDFSPDYFHHQWLALLQAEDALRYATRLVHVRFASEQDRQDVVLGRLREATESDATVRLMRSPLQVTIMATLVERRGKPPQERWGLFNDYYDVIYQREEEKDIATSQLLRRHKPDIEQIHMRTALRLQADSEMSGKTDARLPEADFRSIVEARLNEEEHDESASRRLTSQIIEAAGNRLVFLVGLETGQVGFEIRSLQEFMAARGLMTGADSDVVRRLQAIAAASSWRNVLLFCAGLCFSERQHLRDVLYMLCQTMNEDGSDPIAQRTMAGSVLALELLEDGSARNQPKYARLLCRLALDLLDIDRSDYAMQLGDVYTDDLRLQYIQEVDRRLASTDAAIRLASWRCLLRLIVHEVPWAIQAARRRWPSDATQQEPIVSAASSMPRERWVLVEKAPEIPLLDPDCLSDYDDEAIISDEMSVDVPDWLKAAVSMIQNLDHRSALYQSENRVRAGLRLSYRALGATPVTRIFQNLKLPADAHVGWRAYMGNARFLSNPNQTTLIEALHAANESPSVAMYRYHLAWPLAACLSMVRGGDEIGAISSAIAAGEFGDCDDWQRAEERWEHHGLLAADIRHAAAIQPRPIDERIADIGFPIVGGCSFTSQYSNTSQIYPALIELYQTLPSGEVRSEVADWILWSRVLRSHERRTHQQPDLDLLEALLRDTQRAERALVDIRMLLSYDWRHVAPGMAAEFLDAFGRVARRLSLMRFQVSDSGLTNLLVQIYDEAPDRLGVLHLLADMLSAAPRRRRLRMKTVPQRVAATDFRSTTDALIIRMILSDDIRRRPNRVVEDVVAAARQDESIVVRAAECAGHLPYGSKFLIDLHDAVAVDAGQRRSVLWELEDLARRRKSQLVQQSVWRELALPAVLTRDAEADR